MYVQLIRSKVTKKIRMLNNMRTSKMFKKVEVEKLYMI